MNSVKLEPLQWKPQVISSTNDNFGKFVLVILNRRISCDREVVLSLWNRASLKILVDGGANRWVSFLEAGNLSTSEKKYLPDFITGDLDSISQAVLDHYKSQGIKIIHTPDQNETDFTKALRFMVEHLKEEISEVEAVVCIAESCGRFDQIMANINTLYKAKAILDAPVYLLASNSITWILWPGDHQIEVWPPEGEDLSNKWCSLIPIGCRCNNVSTTGLKWNLNSQALEFGAMVSTSNTYCPGSNEVRVECSEPLVWSMQLR